MLSRIVADAAGRSRSSGARRLGESARPGPAGAGNRYHARVVQPGGRVRHARQVELLRRLADPVAPRPGPLGARSLRNAASSYTCPRRFERERRTLFRERPLLVALSCELREPGAFVTADLGGVPVAVVRQDDGSVRGFVNACRHRGTTLLEGCGRVRAGIACPYHGWTYRLDGSLRGIPGAEVGFDDLERASLGLHPVAVAERHGLVFARAAAGPAFDVDDVLCGAQDELADYGFADHHAVETRTQELDFNWKLVVDTFTETYHIPWLHHATIGSDYFADRWIHDTYGPHSRFIGLHKSVLDELAKPSEDDWRLLPHATTQYLLLPSAILVHQFDHVELWRIVPLAVDRTRVATTLFAPTPPADEKAERYWRRNLDALLHVTGSEDFPTMARIQRNLASGALPEVIYGRMEPALVHFHEAVAAALAAAPELPPT